MCVISLMRGVILHKNQQRCHLQVLPWAVDASPSLAYDSVLCRIDMGVCGLFRILRCDNAVDTTRIGGDLRATHIDPEALTCSRSPTSTYGVLMWQLRISAPAAFLLKAFLSKVLCVKALVVDPELLSLPITSIFILFYFSTSSGTGRRPADPAAPGSWHPQAFSPRGQRVLSPLGGVRSLSSQEKEGQGNKDEEGGTSKEGGDSEEVRLLFFYLSPGTQQ